ncbi:MutS-related protein [Benzoatithermus flavus]|uniref:DNA mismatch repair proteins mutS family domain-containing protein n=1 Tax=Benzoatithermus flavus TaxID=3108223 RepID=A0ABU8XU13_9PROT
MKVFLMHEDRDFDLKAAPPWNEADLTQDLELGTLLDAMAQGDPFLREVAKKAVLSGLTDPTAILYRQAVLRDCLSNRGPIRAIYRLAVEAIAAERKQHLGVFSAHPDAILQRSVTVVRIFVKTLKAIRDIADEHAPSFGSEGFRRLVATLDADMDDRYFATVQECLRVLRFRRGVLVSARLGKGNLGIDYVLRKPHEPKESWLARLFADGPPTYTFHLHPRDEAGARALSELRQRGINLVANALAQSADHILSFLEALRSELAFYIGCINLDEQLALLRQPTCFPIPLPADERRHTCQKLYDVCLALRTQRPVVGNELHADGKGLVVITGANQGGKSTFLRSIGLAQVMMQCGMFVAAEAFSANVASCVVTHYKREEDRSMRSGKLDEELARMSAIVDRLSPNALLLLNESFAATNEREGSEIARQIVLALAEHGIKIIFVTHLYAFAHALHEAGLAGAMFLRAERRADGGRSFKIWEGEPQRTSHGEDLYRRIFDVRAVEPPEIGSRERSLEPAA